MKEKFFIALNGACVKFNAVGFLAMTITGVWFEMENNRSEISGGSTLITTGENGTFLFVDLLAAWLSPCDRCEDGILLQDNDFEGSVSETRCRDEDESESEDMQRHVEFTILEDADYEGGGDSGKPNRLHRRDTPHHLKNKRIHTSIDKDKVASIIAQVSNITTTKTSMQQNL